MIVRRFCVPTLPNRRCASVKHSTEGGVLHSRGEKLEDKVAASSFAEYADEYFGGEYAGVEAAESVVFAAKVLEGALVADAYIDRKCIRTAKLPQKSPVLSSKYLSFIAFLWLFARCEYSSRSRPRESLSSSSSIIS